MKLTIVIDTTNLDVHGIARILRHLGTDILQQGDAFWNMKLTSDLVTHNPYHPVGIWEHEIAPKAMTGEEAYNEDRRRVPDYPHNGQPRPLWHQLDDVVQDSWNRNPTPRSFSHTDFKVARGAGRP